MKYLLDTHVLLWLASASHRIPPNTRELLEEPTAELIFSVVNLWEIVIKASLERQDFQVDIRILRRTLLDNGYSELPVLAEHVMAVAGLPDIHRDPFDRLLIAQAVAEGILFLTADSQIARYPGPIRVV